jgi:hypothetical protein
MYIPNWNSVALATGNVVAAAAVTALATWANTFRTVYSAQGLTFVLGLHHRLEYIGSTGRLHQERMARTEEITGIIVRDNHWDTQRKRGLR